jgi:hypothetical protein
MIEEPDVVELARGIVQDHPTIGKVANSVVPPVAGTAASVASGNPWVGTAVSAAATYTAADAPEALGTAAVAVGLVAVASVASMAASVVLPFALVGWGIKRLFDD